MNEAHEPALRALLLHRMPASEAAALEERIVLEDGFAESLELERIDLLDDYAAGRLDPTDREAVERHLLQTPTDRRRVALARALLARTRPRRPFRWITAVGAALAACLALFLVLPLQRLRAPLAIPDAATASAGRDAAGDPARAGPAYAVMLLAEAERGAASRRIRIPAVTGVLHLQLEVPQPGAPGADFQVVMRDADGQRFAATGLTARDIGPYRVVELDLPRAVAGDGARQLILSQRDPARGTRELFSWQLQVESAP